MGHVPAPCVDLGTSPLQIQSDNWTFTTTWFQNVFITPRGDPGSPRHAQQPLRSLPSPAPGSHQPTFRLGGFARSGHFLRMSL